MTRIEPDPHTVTRAIFMFPSWMSFVPVVVSFALLYLLKDKLFTITLQPEADLVHC
jgi:hypothetical protein